jgi:hypothetical protein
MTFKYIVLSMSIWNKLLSGSVNKSGGQFNGGINDTGGQPRVVDIFTNFIIKLKITL